MFTVPDKGLALFACTTAARSGREQTPGDKRVDPTPVQAAVHHAAATGRRLTQLLTLGTCSTQREAPYQLSTQGGAVTWGCTDHHGVLLCNRTRELLDTAGDENC